MTLLVAGILLGVGLPNVMEFQRSAVMTGIANDFVTGVCLPVDGGRTVFANGV